MVRDKEIVCYTDGSCLKNPGFGGWAYIALKDGEMFAGLAGNVEYGTNNRMELEAVNQCLSCIFEQVEMGNHQDVSNIQMVSDSSYVVNTINKWLEGWYNKKFMHKNGIRLNSDLWIRFIALRQMLSNKNILVNIRWIRAHTDGTDIDSELNAIVDGMAKRAADEIKGLKISA